MNSKKETNIIFPYIRKVRGCFSGKIIYFVEYEKSNWPKHGKMSLCFTLEDAEAELKQYQKENA